MFTAAWSEEITVECVSKWLERPGDLAKVTAIDFPGRFISDDAAALLGTVALRLQRLRTINLSHNRISNEGAGAFARCLGFLSGLKLACLDLSSNCITAQGADELARVFFSVQTRDQTGNAAEPAATQDADNCPSKVGERRRERILDLSENNLQDAGVSAIARHLCGQRRVRLRLRAVCCGNRGLSTLLSFPECLAELDIAGNPVGTSGVASLCRAVSSSSEWHTLRVARLEMSADTSSEGFLVPLQGCLEQARGLRCFDCSGNRLGDLGGAQLAMSLLHQQHLQLDAFQLSGSGCAQHTAEAFRDVLCSCTGGRYLQELHLDDNSLDDAALATLSIGVGQNTTLSVLRLARNKITSAGASAIAAALTEQIGRYRVDRTLAIADGQPGCLVDLDLSENPIGLEGAEQLAKAAMAAASDPAACSFQIPWGLECLRLAGCCVGEHGRSALCAAIAARAAMGDAALAHLATVDPDDELPTLLRSRRARMPRGFEVFGLTLNDGNAARMTDIVRDRLAQFWPQNACTDDCEEIVRIGSQSVMNRRLSASMDGQTLVVGIFPVEVFDEEYFGSPKSEDCRVASAQRPVAALPTMPSPSKAPQSVLVGSPQVAKHGEFGKGKGKGKGPPPPPKKAASAPPPEQDQQEEVGGGKSGGKGKGKLPPPPKKSGPPQATGKGAAVKFGAKAKSAAAIGRTASLKDTPFGRRIHFVQTIYEEPDGGSIFGRLAGAGEAEVPVDFDTELLEAMLGQGGAKAPRRKGLLTQRPAGLTILDAGRAQNIAIVLNKLPVSSGELCDRLRELNFDDECITADTLELLIDVLPTTSEVEKLLKHVDDVEQLRDVEQKVMPFVVLPQCATRLRLMRLAAVHSATHATLLKRCLTVSNAAQEVRESGPLRAVIRVVLRLGNFINHGAKDLREGTFKAFAVESLSTLSSFKTGSISTMHFLCLTLRLSTPSFLQRLQSSLSHVRQAAREQTSMLRAAVEAFVKEVRLAQQGAVRLAQDEVRKERMEALVTELEHEESVLITKLAEAVEAGNDAQQYFSVSASTPAGGLPPCEQFFGHLSDFLDAFEATWQAVERNPSAWKHFAPQMVETTSRSRRRSAASSTASSEDSGRRSSVLSDDAQQLPPSSTNTEAQKEGSAAKATARRKSMARRPKGTAMRPKPSGPDVPAALISASEQTPAHAPDGLKWDMDVNNLVDSIFNFDDSDGEEQGGPREAAKSGAKSVSFAADAESSASTSASGAPSAAGTCILGGCFEDMDVDELVNSIFTLCNSPVRKGSSEDVGPASVDEGSEAIASLADAAPAASEGVPGSVKSFGLAPS
mmetsp:Transcript_158914/g.509709  ORF Transcript_158914/g.509709 Transcript_158914/m.509709 type:complete len:1317 (+) Transcript_158914:83-4033(+)